HLTQACAFQAVAPLQGLQARPQRLDRIDARFSPQNDTKMGRVARGRWRLDHGARRTTAHFLYTSPTEIHFLIVKCAVVRRAPWFPSFSVSPTTAFLPSLLADVANQAVRAQPLSGAARRCQCAAPRLTGRRVRLGQR